MNKLKKSFIVLGVFLFCTACSNELSGNSFQSNSCSLLSYYEKKENFNCPEMQNAKDDFNSYFITNDGDLYEYSDKKYSATNTNCKKYDIDVKFDKFLYSTIVATDGTVYYFNDKGLEKLPNNVYINNIDPRELKKASPNIFMLEHKDFPDLNPDSNKAQNYVSDKFYGTIEDNKIYKVILPTSFLEGSKDLIYTLLEDEKIEKITNGYILTNKAYYKYIVSNKQECSEYADIPCKKELIPVEKIDNCLGKIDYISDFFLVSEGTVLFRK